MIDYVYIYIYILYTYIYIHIHIVYICICIYVLQYDIILCVFCLYDVYSGKIRSCHFWCFQGLPSFGPLTRWFCSMLQPAQHGGSCCGLPDVLHFCWVICVNRLYFLMSCWVIVVACWCYCFWFSAWYLVVGSPPFPVLFVG